jgi:dCMP deaminase
MSKALKIRPEIDEYFLKIAKVVAQRATCLRHNVGAVMVLDKQIISTGYNGAPAGVPDCLELGCLRDQQKIESGTRHEVCRAVHAEQNAIIQAALHGVSSKGATLYITHSPCILCAKMIVNAGIKRVVFYNYYPDNAWETLFQESGITYEAKDEPVLELGDVAERVLVIERDYFNKLGAFEGVKTKNLDEFYARILKGTKYVFREKAEHDLSFKQIIPQFLVRYKDEYFISKRLDSSDEERLRDINYIAFGGHINPIDTSERSGDVIERAAKRELEEELECDILSRKLVGFVNDEKMAVSKYHLCLLYEIELKSKNCLTKEKDQLDGFWATKKELERYFKNGDSWSRYILYDYILA